MTIGTIAMSTQRTTITQFTLENYKKRRLDITENEMKIFQSEDVTHDWC